MPTMLNYLSELLGSSPLGEREAGGVLSTSIFEHPRSTAVALALLGPSRWS